MNQSSSSVHKLAQPPHQSTLSAGPNAYSNGYCHDVAEAKFSSPGPFHSHYLGNRSQLVVQLLDASGEFFRTANIDNLAGGL